MTLSEHDARQAERYRTAAEDRAKLSEGLAGYITIAGALMFVSATVFGGDGETNPMFLAGVGVCAFVGGGAYWLHVRSEEKRLYSEMLSIERHFQAKGKVIHRNGDVDEARR